MKEVSCRVFEIFLREMKRREIEPAVICRGTAVDVRTLTDKNARIDWSEFHKVMRNLGQVFTRHELSTIGRAHVGSPLLMPISLVARLLFNTSEIYQFWTQPNGPGQQLFACIDGKCTVVDDRHVIVEMLVQAGYEPCDEFFYTTIGGLASVPTILGLDFAEVEMERTPFGGRYQVTLPPGDGRLASMRRALTWPFTVRQAGRELRDANEGLIRQYREIAAAQTALSLHTRQLSVAHRISEAMQRALDFEHTLETIASSLEEVAGFAHVAIACDVVDEDGPRALRMSAGEPVPAEPDLVLEFAPEGAAARTTLRLWVPAGGSRTEHEDLAEFLRPTIAIALDNARSRDALDRSRRQLDQRVKELTRAYGLVEQASMVKSQFVANVSHELRTPMNGVLGMTALLRDTALSPDQASYLTMLEQSGQNLLRVINDVLDFSQLEAGAVPLASAAFDLAGSVEEVVRRAAPEALERGVEVLLDVGLDLPARLRGDAARVSQLAASLVHNAVKFTERGAVVVSLAVRSRAEGHAIVRLDVSDTGIGVPPEKLPTLFDPFTQADGSLTRRFGGTGLGLSIARRLAEMMGAEVHAASEFGVGSRFWCDLALEEVAGPEAPAAPLEGVRVLLVDPSPESARVCAGALRGAGAQVEVAADAAAFALVASQGWDAFDVVVRGEAEPGVESGSFPSPPRAKAVLVRDPRATTPARGAVGVEPALVKPLRTDRLVESVAAARRRSLAPAAAPEAERGVERAIVWEPEVLSERILIQLLKKRGVATVAAATIGELARLSAREPAALIFTSLGTNTASDQRELDLLLHRLDHEEGGPRAVAMVSDRGEVPPGHVQRFLSVAARPVRMHAIDEVLAHWRGRRAEPDPPKAAAG